MVRNHAESNPQDVLLIDVREPEEVAMGSIPSSVNLPMSELQQAMKSDYDPGKFRKVSPIGRARARADHLVTDRVTVEKSLTPPQKFLFDKPLPDQNIVFYCLRGKRAATAGEIAGENGYHNVRNYLGSWKDWSTREGQSGNADED